MCGISLDKLTCVTCGVILDQPGMIGRVGNVLGEQNVKVSFISVGRTVQSTQAIMAIGVDEEPGKETLEKIGDVPAIEEFCIPQTIEN